MVVYNYSGKEINAKIVYYGPALSGKTTNLEWIYSKIPVEYSGKMVSLRTQADRTIFFDFLPLDLGMIDGFRTRFMLYTVPGQVHYNATRKMVLKGVDGLVFVADSEPGRMAENIESLQNLRDNLQELGMNPDALPLVMQWNKRDLPNCLPVAELETRLNPRGLPSFEACALTGEGVYETLHKASRLIYTKLTGAQAPVQGEEEVSLFGDSIAQCLQDVDVPQPKPEVVAVGAEDVPVRGATGASDPLGAILGRQQGAGDSSDSSSAPRQEGRTMPVTPVPPQNSAAQNPSTPKGPDVPPVASGPIDRPSRGLSGSADPVADLEALAENLADPAAESDAPHSLSRPVPALSKPSMPVSPTDEADHLGGLVDEVLSSLDERDDIAAIDKSASRPIAPGPASAAQGSNEDRPLAERLDSFFEGIEPSGAVTPIVPADEVPSDAPTDAPSEEFAPPTSDSVTTPADDPGDFSVEHDADVFQELAASNSSGVAPVPTPGPETDSEALELITDPRRLPNGTSGVSSSVGGAALERNGVLEIPVSIDAELLENDTPLRIVLKLEVKR